jgi:predicted Rossmann-fold nucleotide-binding protein
VIFPDGFGTLDQLFESLTLIQTGKIYNFPVILFGSEYWSDLLHWFRETILAGGKISKADLDLVVTDSPEKVRELVMEAMVEGGWLEEKEEAARQERARRIKRKRKLLDR